MSDKTFRYLRYLAYMAAFGFGTYLGTYLEIQL